MDAVAFVVEVTANVGDGDGDGGGCENEPDDDCAAGDGGTDVLLLRSPVDFQDFSS